MPAVRFIGLDIHKHYLLAAGVDADLVEVLAPQRVTWDRFEAWMEHTFTRQDRVVIEMTTNTWEVYDDLIEHVHSVCVVHPPARQGGGQPAGHDRQDRCPHAGETAGCQAACLDLDPAARSARPARPRG